MVREREREREGGREGEGERERERQRGHSQRTINPFLVHVQPINSSQSPNHLEVLM